jgi:PEP-CTERM motif
VKNQGLSLALSLIFVSFALALPASAQQILYENGPINGTTDAWTINFGFIVSDTFTISTGNSTVSGMSFGAWLFPGDILESVQVFITSEEFGGTSYFNQQVNFTASNCSGNQFGFNVCTETGTFTNGPNLANGTYWVNLGNAVVNDGDPVYWDENSGIGCHSPGCPSEPSQNETGSIPAEAFSILGTPSSGSGSVPEPGSLVLFAGGILTAVGIVRRKLI